MVFVLNFWSANNFCSINTKRRIYLSDTSQESMIRKNQSTPSEYHKLIRQTEYE